MLQLTKDSGQKVTFTWMWITIRMRNISAKHVIKFKLIKREKKSFQIQMFSKKLSNTHLDCI